MRSGHNVKRKPAGGASEKKSALDTLAFARFEHSPEYLRERSHFRLAQYAVEVYHKFIRLLFGGAAATDPHRADDGMRVGDKRTLTEPPGQSFEQEGERFRLALARQGGLFRGRLAGDFRFVEFGLDYTANR